jgi:formylglycine-generating enzyme required for sulfatase activity
MTVVNRPRIPVVWVGIILIVAVLTGAAALLLGLFSTVPPSPDMVLVPAGEFIMGSQESRPDERPARRVYVEAFYIDRHQATNAQYAQFLNTVEGPTSRCGGHVCLDTKEEDPDSHILYQRGRYVVEAGYEQHPLTNVSWYGAQAYCRHQGKRLPTEAEWEKAARGTDGRAYPWGDNLDPHKLNSDHRIGDTTPVGSYPAGVSPCGAYDMAGNVWEWVADWYQAYPGSEYQSRFYGEKYKVVRGGSWNHPGSDARATCRDIAHPARRIHVVGFRCTWAP